MRERVSTANSAPTDYWVLRLTQLCPSHKYIVATRRIPAIICGAPCVVDRGSALSRSFLSAGARWWNTSRCWLSLAGFLLRSAWSGFYKVPFTGSYLPEKDKCSIRFLGFRNRFVRFCPIVRAFRNAGARRSTSLFRPLHRPYRCGLWALVRGGPPRKIRSPLLRGNP